MALQLFVSHRRLILSYPLIDCKLFSISSHFLYFMPCDISHHVCLLSHVLPIIYDTDVLLITHISLRAMDLGYLSFYSFHSTMVQSHLSIYSSHRAVVLSLIYSYQPSMNMKLVAVVY